MRAPTKTRSLELQVGLFVLLGIFAMVAFSFRLTESPIYERGIQVVTYLDDATGLFKLTKVRQAGISIGYVEKIQLDKGRAKLTLIIDRGFEFPKDAKVTPKPLGILGDKFLEVTLPKPGDKASEDATPSVTSPGLSPTTPPAPPSPETDKPSAFIEWILPSAAAEGLSLVGEAQAAPAAEPPGAKIKPGDVIESAESGGSMDDLTRQATDVTKDLKKTSKTIRQLVDNDSGQIDQLIRSWVHISSKLEAMLNSIDTKQMGKDLDDMSKAAGRMSHTLQNMDEITSKINRGEGTIGKLINDPDTANQLNKTLTYLNHAIERSKRLQTLVDMNGEYATATGNTKTYVGLTLMTRETSGYIAQVVVDPAGTLTHKITQQSVNGGPETTVDTMTTDKSALKFSLQFLKSIGDTSFRLGIFESTGGVGVDYMFPFERIQLSAELFDLSRDGDRPHLKVYARVPFFTYLYAQVGGDDLITKLDTPDRKRTLYGSLGLRFSDEDIKALFLFAGLP